MFIFGVRSRKYRLNNDKKGVWLDLREIRGDYYILTRGFASFTTYTSSIFAESLTRKNVGGDCQWILAG